MMSYAPSSLLTVFLFDAKTDVRRAGELDSHQDPIHYCSPELMNAPTNILSSIASVKVISIDIS